MLAHDVTAKEVYGEDALRVTPPPIQIPIPSEESDSVENGNDLVTRVRLVQFQKNTDEAMVSIIFMHNRYSFESGEV